MQDSSFGKFADSVLRWEFFIVIPIYLLCFFLPTGLPTLNFLGVFGLIVFIGVAIFRRWRIGYFWRRSPADLPISLFSITAVNAAWLSDFSPAAVARLWVLRELTKPSFKDFSAEQKTDFPEKAGWW